MILKNILYKKFKKDDIVDIILNKYWDLLPKKKILRNCIPENKLYWKNLSYNKNAIDLLKKNQYKIHWKVICLNPNAIELIQYKIQEESYFKKFSVIKLITNLLFDSSLNWDYISSNENAIDIIKKYPHKINWDQLSLNENAIEILTQNPDKINWYFFSLNLNGIDLLKKNLDKVDWCNLSLNDNAIDILENNFDKINWYYLSLLPKVFLVVVRRHSFLKIR